MCSSCISSTNYGLIRIANGVSCSLCVNLHCQTCLNSLCTSCLSGYTTQTTNGISICNLCSTYITNCETCSSQTTCSSCVSSTNYGLYYTTNGIGCSLCASIPNCQTCLNSLCTSCLSGYTI